MASKLRSASSQRRARSPHHSFDIVPSVENVVSSESTVSADVAELLAFPHMSSAHREDRLGSIIGDSDDELDNVVPVDYKSRPWYRRPSPWWILILISWASLVSSMTYAPRTEVYISLVCAHLRPEDTVDRHPPFPNQPVTPLPSMNDSDAYVKFDVPGLPPSMPTLPPATDDRPIVYVPRPSRKCATDSEVAKVVAGLATAVTVTLGVLGTITTGWWANYSDVGGRKRVLGFGIVGLLISETIFIVTTRYTHRVPGGYNLFILGSIADGLMGGMFTSMAAAHAYVSDSTDPAARAQMFSLYLGVVFIGVGLGPSLGGIIVTKTSDVLSVFYIALMGHLLYALVVWFILPESLSAETRAANTSARTAAKLVADGQAELSSTSGRTRIGSAIWSTFKDIFSFLSPLALFLPRKRDISENGYAAGTRDWNLTLLGISSGLVSVLLGSFQFRFQYAVAAFGWGSEQLGYYITAIGAIRSGFLIFILPLIIRFFGPQRSAHRDTQNVDEQDPTQPLLRPTLSSRSPSFTPSHTARITRKHAFHTSHFDLLLGRISLIIEVVSYVLTCVSNNSTQFFAYSSISSFGSGFGPATQSLALFLVPRGGDDAGKYFGALGMVNAVSSQIIGPTIFGATYIATVASFPKGIFVLCSLIMFLSIIALSLIRLPRRYE